MQGNHGVKIEFVLEEYQKENVALSQENKMLKAYIRMLEEKLAEQPETEQPKQK